MNTKISLGKILCLLLIAYISGSCEHIIDFEKYKTEISGITINAIASTDTILMAQITSSYFFDDVPGSIWTEFYDYEKHPDEFLKKSIINDAVVTFQVNDETQSRKMEYDELSMCYLSDYRPAVGDKITISASTQKYPIATATSIVPRPIQINITKSDVIGCEAFDKLPNGTVDIHADSAAIISFNFNDSDTDRNFYRLNVRSVGTLTNDDGSLSYNASNIFTSSDIVFNDERLIEGYGAWPAYFSPVFDDHLFNGKNYSITFQIPFRSGTPTIIIELQSISRDLYYFIKSTELYRITKNDSYTESIQIHSNVTDGYGVFGALSANSRTLTF